MKKKTINAIISKKVYTLKITGGSDDLIEIGGDLEAEFTANDDFDAQENTGGFVAVSDGTLLKVLYDEGGIWRVTLIARGESDFSKVEGDVESDKFDVVTLTSKERFRWVVQGVDYSTSR